MSVGNDGVVDVDYERLDNSSSAAEINREVGIQHTQLPSSSCYSRNKSRLFTILSITSFGLLIASVYIYANYKFGLEKIPSEDSADYLSSSSEIQNVEKINFQYAVTSGPPNTVIKISKNPQETVPAPKIKNKSRYIVQNVTVQTPPPEAQKMNAVQVIQTYVISPAPAYENYQCKTLAKEKPYFSVSLFLTHHQDPIVNIKRTGYGYSKKSAKNRAAQLTSTLLFNLTYPVDPEDEIGPKKCGNATLLNKTN